VAIVFVLCMVIALFVITFTRRPWMSKRIADIPSSLSSSPDGIRRGRDIELHNLRSDNDENGMHHVASERFLKIANPMYDTQLSLDEALEHMPKINRKQIDLIRFLGEVVSGFSHIMTSNL